MPPLKERLQRHRKDTRFVVGGLVALLACLVAVFYLIQRGRDVPETLLNNQLLLFVLWYANIVLILTILFVLLRNLLKLLVERRHRILGSKFKIKLVATYIGLSLIPVLLLFAYATELLQGTVDRWLNTPVAEVLELSYEVVEGFYGRIEERTLVDARHAIEAIADLDVRDPAARPELGRRLQGLLAELSLDYLAVYDGTEFVHGVVDPGSGITDLPEPGQRNLAAAAAGERLVRRIQPQGTDGRLILAAAVAPAAVPEEEPAAEAEATEAVAAPTPADPTAGATVVLAGTLLDPRLVALADDVVQGHLRHRQIVVQKDAVKTSHLLLFLFATLLILLASSWVGLYFARRVTVPIQALVEGTERIGRGDLEHRVEVDADDELGALVGSFNRMTGELRRNREVIERSNRELKEANARLAEERALITAVVDNVAAGVIAFDGEGRILTCNEAALRMLRQSRQEVVGRPAAEAWDDPERGKLAILLASVPDRGEGGVRSGAVVRELQLVLGGEWKSFEVKVTAMPPASPSADEPGGRVMVLEDLSELIRAQQLAAWNEAARRIAHEIKNPLTPIRLAAERILQKHRRGDADLGQALETGIAVMLREVGAMQAMVDEFSRFARMPRPHPTRMDLGKLVEETAPLYRELKPGVDVATRVEPGVEALMADPEQLKRALINLIENALEATEAPGRVTVSVTSQNGHAELAVADTGRGIPDADKDKLFLPYFSTKGRGTGLGLAIVHRIVSDHRGTIRVEDNDPRGTVFTVELPLR